MPLDAGWDGSAECTDEHHEPMEEGATDLARFMPPAQPVPPVERRDLSEDSMTELTKTLAQEPAPPAHSWTPGQVTVCDSRRAGARFSRRHGTSSPARRSSQRDGLDQATKARVARSRARFAHSASHRAS